MDELYRNFAKPLYFYLLKLSGSPHLAEDLTQETFVRATISLSSVQHHENIRAWLLKTARNAYLDEWRKREKRKWIPFAESLLNQREMLSPYGLPEDEAIKAENQKDVERLLSCLPEIYRSAIYLREIEGLSYTEIQKALDLTEGQVKVTLHRAKKKLAHLMESKSWRSELLTIEMVSFWEHRSLTLRRPKQRPRLLTRAHPEPTDVLLSQKRDVQYF
ncbi:RNA polymerase sigma factor [Sporolactobacillus shoreae]|uniref:RNA polymerase sigma factor n=1 Tax=Sporolactobacillus shoreae TaxID=1465501 RepID=UPI001F4F16A9|nr:sigma-70 family RNA polymerase sigma factor [Sporolactobacillus shoreae]